MSKKDYELLAKFFNSERIKYSTRNDNLSKSFLFQIECMADSLARELKVENNRFDEEKFIKACGF